MTWRHGTSICPEVRDCVVAVEVKVLLRSVSRAGAVQSRFR
jgi:hypothetical protein